MTKLDGYSVTPPLPRRFNAMNVAGAVIILGQIGVPKIFSNVRGISFTFNDSIDVWAGMFDNGFTPGVC